MTFEYLHYFETNISDRPFIITHYSLIWINISVKWLLLDQFDLNTFGMLVKSPVACFVVVVPQAIMCLH